MKGLGERIKFLRKDKKLTLVEVSHRTGIDTATLSRIENGVMTGTVGSHMKIAEVLGLSLPDLYKDAIAKISAPREKAAREKVETFAHSSGAVAELLTQGILQKKMMPVMLRIKTGGRTAQEEFPTGTERFVYVVTGKLHIVHEGREHTLNAGESFYFNGSVTHWMKNAGRGECAVLSVITPVSL